MKKFLILFHRTTTAQPMAQWNDFVAMLHAGDHLIGGASLARPVAIKRGKTAKPKAASVGGYMVVQAKNATQAKGLMKHSPTHLAGGHVDLFPLE